MRKGEIDLLASCFGGMVGPVTGDGSVEWERGKFESNYLTLGGERDNIDT